MCNYKSLLFYSPPLPHTCYFNFFQLKKTKQKALVFGMLRLESPGSSSGKGTCDKWLALDIDPGLLLTSFLPGPFSFFHFFPILPFWTWLPIWECRPTRHRRLIRVRVTHTTNRSAYGNIFEKKKKEIGPLLFGKKMSTGGGIWRCLSYSTRIFYTQVNNNMR